MTRSMKWVLAVTALLIVIVPTVSPVLTAAIVDRNTALAMA